VGRDVLVRVVVSMPTIVHLPAHGKVKAFGLRMSNALVSVT
jgi:hypothetical protein